MSVLKTYWIYNFLNRFRKRPLDHFRDVGFHGDANLVEFISSVIQRSEQFIETGSSVGSTLIFVAKEFPDMPIWSCEPDRDIFMFANQKAKAFPNVKLLMERSPGFLYRISKEDPNLTGRDTTFWLDSHANGFKWPLFDEVRFATSRFAKGYMFIDDFLVPGQPQFGHDEYDGQICSFEYIKGALAPGKTYTIHYPSYKETKGLYNQMRGWVLIEYGHAGKLEIPPDLKDKITVTGYAAI